MPTSWPTPFEFNKALQNPSFAFSDRDLMQLEFKRDSNNLPAASSGNFACVYKGIRPNNQGAVAVRVFTRPGVERREHYDAIAKYLSGRPKLNSLVKFDYADKGIRCADDSGKLGRFPLVTMDWVAGTTLDDWLRQACTNRQATAVNRLADLWLATVTELKAADIVHGDLQHGNVMVNDAGEIKLVDYDCMCVPALRGRVNLEVGVPVYQHPQRDGNTTLTPYLDHYSTIVIFTALKALANDTNLWKTYVDDKQNKDILFCPEDFAAPDHSPLLHELGACPDQDVRRFSKALLDFRRVPLDQVPPLDELLFSFNNVAALLDKREFDQAVEMLDRGKKQVADAPPALQSRLKNAQQRIKQRKDLEAAVASGDEALMEKLYAPPLLDDYPLAQSSVSVAKQAPRVIPLLAKLEQIKQQKKWRDFVRQWDSDAGLLGGRKSAAKFAALADEWRRKNAAADRVVSLFQHPDVDGPTLDQAWRQLTSLGGHPETESLGPQISHVVERAVAWATFREAPITWEDAADKQLAAAWNEALFKGWPPAEKERKRVAEAADRLRVVQEIVRLGALPLERATESKIAQLAAKLDGEYQHAGRRRGRDAQARVDALVRVERLAVPTGSDREIVEAWQVVTTLGAEPLVDVAKKGRIDDALKRTAILKKLQAVPPAYAIHDADEFDEKLLAAWPAAVDPLLANCREADPWRSPRDVAARRRAVLKQINDAYASGNTMLMAELSQEPTLAGYRLGAEMERQIKATREDLDAIAAITGALRSGNTDELARVFNARIIRDYAPQFTDPDFRRRISETLRGPLRTPKALRLKGPLAQKAVEQQSYGAELAFQVRWNWPDSKLSEHCRLVVMPSQPRGEIDPTEIPHSYSNQSVERRAYESAGGRRTINAQAKWLGAYVAVWALIDVGFDKVWSEPVVLGRLETARMKR